MKLCIIGSGYVGLVTGACFSEVGHTVICVDNNLEKIEQLKRGEIPIYEPGLEDIVKKNVALGRLSFTTSTDEAVKQSTIIFIAVPTPPQPDGSVDLSFVEKVAREIAQSLPDEYRVVVDKSTVPVKTGERVAQTIHRYRPGCSVDVVSNPEFLREGSAVEDLMKPDRIVIGTSSEKATAAMMEVYAPFRAPIMVTDLNSAELIKHASNSFLALKISYINAISAICESSGANVEYVAEGMGADKRIGRAFLNAGVGYGGSCFPKDLSAFIRISSDLGYDFQLLKEVEKINRNQRERFLKKLRDALWILQDKKLGVLGLTFKGNTDDVRNSVAIEIIQQLVAEGAKIRAYDPKGMEKARAILPASVQLVEEPELVAESADAILLLTEWNDFKHLDWHLMAKKTTSPLLFDGRNLLNPSEMRHFGFTYTGMGR